MDVTGGYNGDGAASVRSNETMGRALIVCSHSRSREQVAM